MPNEPTTEQTGDGQKKDPARFSDWGEEGVLAKRKDPKPKKPPTKKQRDFNRFGDWSEDTIEFEQRTHEVGEE